MAPTKHDPHKDGELLEKSRPKPKEPERWKVLLHNDDFTTQEFVVMVLVQIFRKSPEDATRIMLAVHRSGLGVAGVYSHELAETKVDQTMRAAAEHGYPLLVTMEPE